MLVEVLNQTEKFFSFMDELNPKLFGRPDASTRGPDPSAVPMDIVPEETSTAEQVEEVEELLQADSKSCSRCCDRPPVEHCQRDYVVEADPEAQKYIGAVLTSAKGEDRLQSLKSVRPFSYTSSIIPNTIFCKVPCHQYNSKPFMIRSELMI